MYFVLKNAKSHQVNKESNIIPIKSYVEFPLGTGRGIDITLIFIWRNKLVRIVRKTERI